jgi:AraC-like DNA-binding protein
MKDAAIPERATFWRAPDLGNLELLRATYLQHSFARHSHEGFMIGVIEQGGCRFYYRGAFHVAAAGSLVFINPGEPHDGTGAEAARMTYRALYPEAALLQRATSELAGRQHGVPSFPEPVAMDEAMSRLVRGLHQLLEVAVSPLERESRFLETFALIIGRYAEHRPSPLLLGSERQAVRQAREYLETYHAEQVTLTQLARVADLSPFHFLRVFRAEIGLPPHVYLTQVRVQRAKTLLSLGMPIPQVAYATGFVDQSHLTRHFKRFVGVTPGQYVLGSKNVQDRAVRPRYTHGRNLGVRLKDV